MGLVLGGIDVECALGDRIRARVNGDIVVAKHARGRTPARSGYCEGVVSHMAGACDGRVRETVAQAGEGHRGSRAAVIIDRAGRRRAIAGQRWRCYRVAVDACSRPRNRERRGQHREALVIRMNDQVCVIGDTGRDQADRAHVGYDRPTPVAVDVGKLPHRGGERGVEIGIAGDDARVRVAEGGSPTDVAEILGAADIDVDRRGGVRLRRDIARGKHKPVSDKTRRDGRADEGDGVTPDR